MYKCAMECRTVFACHVLSCMLPSELQCRDKSCSTKQASRSLMLDAFHVLAASMQASQLEWIQQSGMPLSLAVCQEHATRYCVVFAMCAVSLAESSNRELISSVFNLVCCVQCSGLSCSCMTASARCSKHKQARCSKRKHITDPAELQTHIHLVCNKGLGRGTYMKGRMIIDKHMKGQRHMYDLVEVCAP